MELHHVIYPIRRKDTGSLVGVYTKNILREGTQQEIILVKGQRPFPELPLLIVPDNLFHERRPGAYNRQFWLGITEPTWNYMKRKGISLDAYSDCISASRLASEFGPPQEVERQEEDRDTGAPELEMFSIE